SSAALNPLDEYRPGERQIVAGLAGGWRASRADLRLEYRREVDPRADKVVSERVGIDGAWRLTVRWALTAGADYNIAEGRWGNAEAAVAYAGRSLRAAVGTRRYRPQFPLWTIWGAFSPVPYRAVYARLAVPVGSTLELRGRGELYAFAAAEAATPLVEEETDGSRWELGATYRPAVGWSIDAGWHREFGPGAASAGLEGSATYAPSHRLGVVARLGNVYRPLEFRYSDAALWHYGVDVDVQPTPQVRVSVGATRYDEERRRPDAAAIEWDQLRLTARVVLLFGSGADLGNLPPAVRRMPGGRAAR
ncbi:MAG: hypothetical protein ACREMV_07660, partial [Gemmatimonadales bacterium]